MATTLDIQTPRRYLDPKSDRSFFPMMGCFQVTVPTVQKPIKTSQSYTRPWENMEEMKVINPNPRSANTFSLPNFGSKRCSKGQKRGKCWMLTCLNIFLGRVRLQKGSEYIYIYILKHTKGAGRTNVAPSMAKRSLGWRGNWPTPCWQCIPGGVTTPEAMWLVGTNDLPSVFMHPFWRINKCKWYWMRSGAFNDIPAFI